METRLNPSFVIWTVSVEFPVNSKQVVASDLPPELRYMDDVVKTHIKNELRTPSLSCDGPVMCCVCRIIFYRHSECRLALGPFFLFIAWYLIRRTKYAALIYHIRHSHQSDEILNVSITNTKSLEKCGQSAVKFSCIIVMEGDRFGLSSHWANVRSPFRSGLFLKPRKLLKGHSKGNESDEEPNKASLLARRERLVKEAEEQFLMQLREIMDETSLENEVGEIEGVAFNRYRSCSRYPFTSRQDNCEVPELRRQRQSNTSPRTSYPTHQDSNWVQMCALSVEKIRWKKCALQKVVQVASAHWEENPEREPIEADPCAKTGQKWIVKKAVVKRYQWYLSGIYHNLKHGCSQHSKNSLHNQLLSEPRLLLNSFGKQFSLGIPQSLYPLQRTLSRETVIFRTTMKAFPMEQQ
ncbi:hypothetical protein CLF_109295 [Clonorchis sinensis]|uniref:Uncharacterized protein n=1 Tax=Clonorchis sinensis TaxID=79923 RepID=G7YJ63_CLOSI|nr:hypothetical protein CLF_109295 [Clonorchis sinensis]